MYQFIRIATVQTRTVTHVYICCGSKILQHFIETQLLPEVMELSIEPIFLPAHPFNDRPCATSYVDHARNQPKELIFVYMHDTLHVHLNITFYPIPLVLEGLRYDYSTYDKAI